MSFRPFLLFACALALAGCHKHKKNISTVEWAIDPSTLGEPFARVSFDGKDLYLGWDGERWMGDEIATEVSEPLVSVRKRDGVFQFAGKSGAIYESGTALGKLRRVRDALERPRSISFGETTVIAIDDVGNLLRSTDDGKSFTPVVLPEQGRLARVTMLGKTGVLVGVPSVAYATHDDGATWKPIEPPRNGVVRLVDSIVASDQIFDPKKNAFVDEIPLKLDRERDITRWAMDGSRAVRIFGKADTWKARDVRIQVKGAETKSLWEECLQIDVAMRGDVIVATCDGEEKDQIVRSTDGGKTFQPIATDAVGGSTTHASLAIGDNFFFYGERCKGAKCTAPRVYMNDAWKDITTGGDAVAFAYDAKTLYHLSEDLSVYRWSGGQPTFVAKLPQMHFKEAHIGVERDTIRVTVRGEKEWLAYDVHAGDVQPFEIPPSLERIAFAGNKGLARDERGLLETTDGKTWHRVLGLPVHEIASCSTGGCITDRGVRFGWARRADHVTIDLTTFARPFDCHPTSDWTEIGTTQSWPTPDHGDARWIVALRDERGAVRVAKSTWDGETQKIDLMRAPEGEDRSLTSTYVQPNGVIARRLQYRRGTGGERNPVRMSAKWMRLDGHVYESTPRVIGTFFVPFHDPHPFNVEDDVELESGPFTTYLGSHGLWIHAPRTGLWHLQDDGVAQTYFGQSFDLVDQPNIVVEGETPYLLALGSRARVALPRMDDTIDMNPLLETPGDLAFHGTHVIATAFGSRFLFDITPSGKAENVKTALGPMDEPCFHGSGEGGVAVPYIAGERHPVVVGDHVYATSNVRVRIVNSACLVGWETESIDEEHRAIVYASDSKQSVEFRRDKKAWPSTLSMRTISCEPADLPFPKELSKLPGFAAPSVKD